MILAAAIRHDGTVYALPAPKRHHDVIHHICEQLGINHVPGSSMQGFIDSEHGFVSREDATRFARRDGQIRPDHTNELYSEDLW